jgi:hypothetical protein
MGKNNIRELTQEDIDRFRAEIARLGGGTPRTPLQPRQSARRGDVARSIRSRQKQIAKRSSVDIIREERDAL